MFNKSNNTIKQPTQNATNHQPKHKPNNQTPNPNKTNNKSNKTRKFVQITTTKQSTKSHPSK